MLSRAEWYNAETVRIVTHAFGRLQVQGLLRCVP
jgi:hypothetical protein